MLYTNNENIAKSLNLQIPEGSTLLDEVLKLDEETFNTVISSIEQSIKSMDNMVLDQYAISGIKSIYNEIGMDMNQYQINYIINKGLTMLSIAGIGMVIAVIVGFLVAKLASKIGYVLRNKVVKKSWLFLLLNLKNLEHPV